MAFLGNISAELGEFHMDLDSLPDVAEQFKAIKLPFNKALIGCNKFHRSNKSADELLRPAIESTLRSANLKASEVQALIICSADISALQEDREALPGLLASCELDHAVPYLITGQECTGLLSGIMLADTMLSNLSTGNILVASFDLAGGSERVKPFGVASDAAFCCLVSGSQNSYEILGACNKTSLAGMLGKDDFNSREKLALEGTQETLKGEKLQLSDIQQVFSTNFYKPIADFNASTLGVAKSQLYIPTSGEHAHCVCGDALLNLMHFEEQQLQKQGQLHLLQSYAPGWLASILIRVAE